MGVDEADLRDQVSESGKAIALLVARIGILNTENDALLVKLNEAANFVETLATELEDAKTALLGPEQKGVYFGTFLARTFHDMCLSAGAQNYVEMGFKNPDYEMIVTAQRVEGTRPGFLVKEAADIFRDLTYAFTNGKDLHPYMLAAIAWLARTSKK